MVNHDIVRLHIPVHDTLAVAEIQGLQKLENIVTDIIVGEPRVESPEIRVVDIFEHQAWRLALTVANHVQQGDHIGATRQVLKDLDFTLNLLLLDRLEYLDDAFLVVDNVDALEHFGVLSAACSKWWLAQNVHNSFAVRPDDVFGVFAGR